MVYAIWDTESANIVDSYRSEAEALADVRDAVTRFGRSYAASWALACHEGNDTIAIAEGEALIDRALGVRSAQHP
ncbi:MAG: hypothetical protein ACRDJE_09255 [Dehalococcoidia bacterium]